MLWFKSQIEKDQEDTHKQFIAIAEYLAGFINPRAVSQVRNSRANTKQVDDENLIRSLQSISGLSREQVLKNIAVKPRGN